MATGTGGAKGETYDALVRHCTVTLPGASDGPLAGLTFAIKDLFDVKGVKTGFGNPRWLETHDPAEAHAPVVQTLLDAGATAVGKTQMDELAYSINGENFHYGTPLNPRARGRIPGGSSSGSVSAVAQGLCDFALGSDTGGSVRVPASYCGVLGIRPTHGRVSMEGSRPLAPSFDTGGWFAKDAATLQAVGSAVLTGPANTTPITRWLVGTDAFELADKETGQAIYGALAGTDSATFERVVALLGPPQELAVARPDETLADWFQTFRVLQAAEVWACHGDWVTSAQPVFGPGIKDRFQMASQITPEQVAAAAVKRAALIEHLDALLADGAVLMVPSTPGPGPVLDMDPAALDEFRGRALSLTAIAGLGKLPQVNLPVAEVDGAPVGLGLIGARGSDEALLELACKLAGIVPLTPSPPPRAL